MSSDEGAPAAPDDGRAPAQPKKPDRASEPPTGGGASGPQAEQAGAGSADSGRPGSGGKPPAPDAPPPQPAETAASPPKPAASPPKPAASPPKPAASPPKPAASPPKPAASPPKPAASPPKPAASPPKPAASPPKPAAKPPAAKPAKPPPPPPPEFETRMTARIAERFGDRAEIIAVGPNRTAVRAAPGAVKEVATFIRDELNFDHAESVSGVDYPKDNAIEVVYHLGSYLDPSLARQVLALHVRAPREDSPDPGADSTRLPSLRDVFYSVEFHERECFEMLGVYFEGHPDNRRLLLPEDWADLPPLRKDFAIKGR